MDLDMVSEFEDNPQPTKKELRKMLEKQRLLEEKLEQEGDSGESQRNLAGTKSPGHEDSNYNFKKGGEKPDPKDAKSRRESVAVRAPSGLQKSNNTRSGSILKTSAPQSPTASGGEKVKQIEDEMNKELLEEQSDVTSEEEKKIYTYKCPVFRVSNNFAQQGRHI